MYFPSHFKGEASVKVSLLQCPSVVKNATHKISCFKNHAFCDGDINMHRHFVFVPFFIHDMISIFHLV